MEHSFDIEIAKKYDISQAILLKHIYYWVTKNDANDTNYYDGNYWTYNSCKGFAELFPYMSADTVKRTLKKMLDNGLILKGNYSENRFKRANWYTLTKKGLNEILHIDFSSAKTPNTLGENAECTLGENAECINTDINTDVNTNSLYCRKENEFDVKVEQIVTYLNDRCNTKYSVKTKSTIHHIKGRLDEGKTVDDFITVIDKKCDEWLGTEYEKYLTPDTLFRPSNFERYLNQKIVKKQERYNPAIY